MKKIVFFETKDERYGYMTVETEFQYAKGSEIDNTEFGDVFVLKEVEATQQNYRDAKALMNFCRKHDRIKTFKYNLERNW